VRACGAVQICEDHAWLDGGESGVRIEVEDPRQVA
jgi:hypothetical protein